MSVETFNPSSELITVSEKASKHFASQLSGSEANAVRLSVKENGCTGYSYVLDLVAEPQSEDIDVALPSGLHVFVASDSVAVVQGTEIDYVVEGVNSVIKFKNPNARDYCGCGESFSVN